MYSPYIPLIFLICVVRMFNLPDSRFCGYVYVVCYKACRENTPASVETMPASWIVTEVPLKKARGLFKIAHNALSLSASIWDLCWERSARWIVLRSPVSPIGQTRTGLSIRYA
jgi:hypothetical protein